MQTHRENGEATKLSFWPNVKNHSDSVKATAQPKAGVVTGCFMNSYITMY
jgi:hypothetical protein